MSGFIIMERDALEHPLLRDPARFYAWFWMIARACWKPTRYDVGGKLILLDRGQFCVSVRALADAWGWPKSNVDRFLHRLKAEGMIGTENGTGRLVITILNYDKYQSRDDGTGTVTGTPDALPKTPNDTRTQPDQKPGQQRDTANPQKTAENDDYETGDRDSSGTAAGQQRDIKEQGNKGTRIDPDGSIQPPTPFRDRNWPEIPEWIPVAPWNGFIDMRKRKKATTPTPRAVELLLAKLDQLRRAGHDPGAVLDQSTLKNWTDLYPLKDQDHGDEYQHRPRNNDEPQDPFVRASIELQAERAAAERR